MENSCSPLSSPMLGPLPLPLVNPTTVSLTMAKYSDFMVFPEIWVIPNYAKTVLGFDANVLLDDLAHYPVRRSGDRLEVGGVQWVEGNNRALQYRGHNLNRAKIWLQNDDPKDHGFLRYLYTGWQWLVLKATAFAARCGELVPILHNYARWCKEEGVDIPNHYIITRYVDENHSIGFHFDKPNDIKPGSLITIVKLGPASRPFQLRARAGPGENQNKMPVLFDKVFFLPPILPPSHNFLHTPPPTSTPFFLPFSSPFHLHFSVFVYTRCSNLGLL